MAMKWVPKDATVNTAGLEPAVADKLDVLADCRKEALAGEQGNLLTITSGHDGKHGVDSLHDRGLAVDVRSRSFVDRWAVLLKAKLGRDYDVVKEDHDVCKGCGRVLVPHIHVEYDPK